MSISLLNGLHMAYRGIQATEENIKVASQNITNADRAGYTRKSYTADYITGNFGTVPIGGTVSSSLNQYLVDGVVNDTFDVSRKNVIAEYLDVYIRRTGDIVSDFSLTSTLNEFFTNLDLLAVTPENRAQKSQIVSDAEVIALYLRDMSSSIQEQRTDAELEIDKTINRINESLTVIDDINDKILLTSGKNATTLVEYEDQRVAELQKLAEEIDVTFFYDNSNRMQVYLPSGQPLITSSPYYMSFDPQATLTTNVTYPGIINPIEVNGVDVTNDIGGGKLAGLIELRDEVLINEQEKYDEFANVLMDTMNAVLNTGASRPPRNEMTGDEGFSAADPWAGSGFVRIGLTNENGVVQSFTNIDLSTYGTVGDVVTALNVTGITASLGPAGELVLTSTDPTLGISINEMDSDIGAENQGFSDYFGLNDMFSGEGARNIRVADYLLEDSDLLALGRFDGSAGLAIGDVGITVGDTSVVEGLSTALDASVSFDAAGDFSAQSLSLRSYAESIMSRAALNASNAADAAESAEVIRQQGADFMNNVTGVNIDEETAILLELESHYQASAQVIAVIKGLLEELIAAVR